MSSSRYGCLFFFRSRQGTKILRLNVKFRHCSGGELIVKGGTYLADTGGGSGNKDDFAGDIFGEEGAKDTTAEFEEDPWREEK